VRGAERVRRRRKLGAGKQEDEVKRGISWIECLQPSTFKGYRIDPSPARTMRGSGGGRGVV
jgi:hypothetical protein